MTDTKKYTVISPIKFDGRVYKVDAPIDLDSGQAEELRAYISGPVATTETAETKQPENSDDQGKDGQKAALPTLEEYLQSLIDDGVTSKPTIAQVKEATDLTLSGDEIKVVWADLTAQNEAAKPAE